MVGDRNDESMSQPLVSIIMAMYNDRAYVAEAVESALAQAYPNIELIVIDDGSTDGGHEIVESFRDSRIRLHRTANRGLPAARNLGVKLAQGQLITFLDSDDLLTRRSIVSRQQALKQFGAEIVFSKSMIIKHETQEILRAELETTGPTQVPKVWKSSDLLQDFLRQEFAAFSQAFVMRKKVCQSLNGFNESCRIHEDMEFLSRLLQLDHVLIETYEPIYVIRRRSGSLSAIDSPRKAADALHALNMIRANLAPWFEAHPELIAQQLFSRCVKAYPHWTEGHRLAMQEAHSLMNGRPFDLSCVGGPRARAIARLFGWRAARFATRARQRARRALGLGSRGLRGT